LSIAKIGIYPQPRAGFVFPAAGWKNSGYLLYKPYMRFPFSRDVGPLFVLAVGAALILVLNVPVANSWFKNAVYGALAPVQRNIWAGGARVSAFIDSISSMSSASAENERLRRQVNDLTVKTAQLGELKKENDFLRQGLNLELDKDFDLKLAGIIGKDASRDVLIIDKGSNDLVEAGMPVITAEKAVVGKISKVYADFAEVALITGRDFSFDVKVGDDAVDCLVKGRGGLSAAIDLVPKDKKLEAGAAVITSPLGGIFPAGLLVGTVGDVDTNDVEMFQSGSVVPAFDFNGEKVFVANAKSPAVSKGNLNPGPQNEK